MRPVSHLSLVTLTVFLLMLLHVSAGLAGNTLYVKTSGSDSANCTAAAPCATIKHAVSVAASGDTITVGAGTFIQGDSISIDKNLTIAGGWFLATRVTRYPLTQGYGYVLEIQLGAEVKLTGLTISGGNLGGISNRGSLTLTNVWITNSTIGISNALEGKLFTTNVGIDHNSGRGLENWGTALVVDSHIEGSYHHGTLPGDGVYNDGTLIMSQGLIAGNEGTGSFQIACTATTYLVNATISGNHKGGIYAQCGQLLLRHVTIAANTAGSGPGGLQVQGVIPVVENSIVAKNSGKQCSLAAPSTSTPSISISHSLVSDDSCTSPLFPTTAGNLVGVDPKLSDALAYRVGESWIEKLFLIGANRVHALLPGSPAIDSAADEFCADPIFSFTSITKGFNDQLGLKRPIDGDGDDIAQCDMGAYEYQPPGSVPK